MSDHEFAVGGAILLGVMNAWIIAFLFLGDNPTQQNTQESWRGRLTNNPKWLAKTPDHRQLLRQPEAED